MSNPTITLTVSGSDDAIEVARHECSACRCAGFMVASGDYTPEVEHEGGTVLVERPDDAVPLQAGVDGGRELDQTYCEECAEERAEELDAVAADEPAPVPVVRCQCGEITGEACQWRGPIDETEMVTWLPGQWRETVRACGSWSGLGQRLRLETSCAESLAEHEGEWLLRAAS